MLIAHDGMPLQPDQALTMACRELFQTLDVDGSGGINIKELGSGLKELGYAVTQVRPDASALMAATQHACHILILTFEASNANPFALGERVTRATVASAA